MNKLRLVTLLRYLAAPFAIVALLSWLKPAYFPSWVLGISLFLAFCFLLPSIINRSAKQ